MNQEIQGAFAVTPSDTVDQPFSALYIGVTGDVAITTRSGQVVAFGQVPVGRLNISGTRVMATGTGATEIVGLNG